MITVLKPGLLTSIQDLGRVGYKRYGVVSSGAMDSYSMRLANILVGNNDGEATLEITMIGPKLAIQAGTLISIVGAEFIVKLNGVNLANGRPIYIKEDSILEFGKCINGCRCYLAVAGGFDIPSVMESKSTYIKAKIGGYQGRGLMAGDIIYLNNKGEISKSIINKLISKNSNRTFSMPKWFIKSYCDTMKNEIEIRVIQGRQYDRFKQESKEKFYSNKYMVKTDSDRMGYRLKGVALQLKEEFEMISEAVSVGTIQVPKDGDPIILLSDCQTTGGYPIIAQVALVDIQKVAQLKPNDYIKFKEVTREAAIDLYKSREEYIKHIKKIINVLFSI